MRPLPLHIHVDSDGFLFFIPCKGVRFLVHCESACIESRCSNFLVAFTTADTFICVFEASVADTQAPALIRLQSPQINPNPSCPATIQPQHTHSISRNGPPRCRPLLTTTKSWQWQSRSVVSCPLSFALPISLCPAKLQE